MSDLAEETTFEPLIGRSIVLTGSTASGKSALALALAERLDGEILSLDSIAVYRGMDIGTAKATAEEQARLPHHLIDLAQPNEDFSVACYLKAAHRCVDEIRRRGKTPVFVGGTPMFLKAIVRGFDPGPPPDWDFRKSVESDVEKHGIEPLRARLEQVDPLSAHRIAPGDVRRMVRALEVSKLTGVPLSHRQVQFDQSTPAEDCNVFALRWPRPELHRRINKRVERMFELGLVNEVRTLMTRYGQLSRTASQAVGYREIIDAMNTGEWGDAPSDASIELLRDSVATHTRQLAKRQETWFRSFSEITTIDVDSQRTEHELTDSLIGRIRSSEE